MLLDPPVLLMDDPTAAIDPETENEILAAMASAMANRTTFVVAHRLSTLRRADQILVLDRGRIVERGTHEELMAHGEHYAEGGRDADGGRDLDRDPLAGRGWGVTYACARTASRITKGTKTRRARRVLFGIAGAT